MNSQIIRFLWLIFGAVTAWTIIVIPHESLGLKNLGSPRLVMIISLALGLLVLFLAAKTTALVDRCGSALADHLSHAPACAYLLAITGVGLFLRLLWIGYFPVPLQSDSAAYFALAQSLFETGAYADRMGVAYWPPGYPLFLYSVFWITGPQVWAAILSNLMLYAAASWFVYRLARDLGGERVARVAILLLAVWPNYVFMANHPSKESLLIALVPLAFLFYFRAAAPAAGVRRTIGLGVVAGSTLGFASLTQPGLMPLAAVFACDALLRRQPAKTAVVRLAAFALGMLLVISPWTLRNYHVLQEFVPIATNGGDNFYRANNPSATGSFAPRGERSFEGFSEIERNRNGFRWGVDWIKAEPLAFAYLAVKKQINLLGDDVFGPHYTFVHGSRTCGTPCQAAMAIANAYWLGVWVLLLASWWRHSEFFQEPNVMMLILAFLCVVAVHSVFESGHRHHTQLMGILVILAAGIGHHRVGDLHAPRRVDSASRSREAGRLTA